LELLHLGTRQSQLFLRLDLGRRELRLQSVHLGSGFVDLRLGDLGGLFACAFEGGELLLQRSHFLRGLLARLLPLALQSVNFFSVGGVSCQGLGLHRLELLLNSLEFPSELRHLGIRRLADFTALLLRKLQVVFELGHLSSRCKCIGFCLGLHCIHFCSQSVQFGGGCGRVFLCCCHHGCQLCDQGLPIGLARSHHRLGVSHHALHLSLELLHLGTRQSQLFLRLDLGRRELRLQSVHLGSGFVDLRLGDLGGLFACAFEGGELLLQRSHFLRGLLARLLPLALQSVNLQKKSLDICLVRVSRGLVLALRLRNPFLESGQLEAGGLHRLRARCQGGGGRLLKRLHLGTKLRGLLLGTRELNLYGLDSSVGGVVHLLLVLVQVHDVAHGFLCCTRRHPQLLRDRRFLARLLLELQLKLRIGFGRFLHLSFHLLVVAEKLLVQLFELLLKRRVLLHGGLQRRARGGLLGAEGLGSFKVCLEVGDEGLKSRALVHCLRLRRRHRELCFAPSFFFGLCHRELCFAPSSFFGLCNGGLQVLCMSCLRSSSSLSRELPTSSAAGSRVALLRFLSTHRELPLLLVQVLQLLLHADGALLLRHDLSPRCLQLFARRVRQALQRVHLVLVDLEP